MKRNRWISASSMIVLPWVMSLGACDAPSLLANCGDGAVQAEEAEQCDDGNNASGDGCDSLCQNEAEAFCGDGSTDPGEECDDGNNASGDGCDPTCASEAGPQCGDNRLDAEEGEECDDGNRTAGDGCDNLCQIESTEAIRHVDPTIFWVDDNRERLNNMLDQFGSRSIDFDPANPPVAALDFDNTLIKNDIGDATMFFMINNDKILQPANQNWALTSPLLTQAAISALNAACDGLAAPGQPLPTSTNTDCADEIVSVYFNEKTTSAEPAFAGFDLRQIEPGFAWAAQLQAGYTPAQINAIADAALLENLQNPIGTTQTVGTISGLNHFIRFYDQMVDLIGALQEDGFDVWIVSASPQEVVEAGAFHLGIAPDHVIGIRTVVDPATGKTTHNLQGCGDIPDGSNDGAGNATGNSLITFIDGKRCWINKVIYGDNTASALAQNPDLKKRPVFAAGDSDTDITFLQDSIGLRLAFNRQKKELMCFAYHNADGKWIVNPTPIQPKDKRSSPYPCSTNACLDSNGVGVPCVENGVIIPDQEDTVFCAGGVYCSEP